MTPGLDFALAAMLCFGAGDLIYKRAAAAGIEASQFVMLQAWVFCPGVTLYAWLTGTITAALAILLLGETLTITKLVALACALVAVWLLLAEPAARRVRPNLSSLTHVLIATVAMALANLFYKVGLQQGAPPETMVAAQAWAFCSTATLLGWLRERRFRFTPGAWRYSTLAAVTLAVAFVLLLHGLVQGPASVLVPVAQMSFVFTALLGAAMFRETLDLRKRAGLLVAAVALALFAAS